MMMEEKYYVFEIQNSWGASEEHLFTSKEYFNEKLEIKYLSLLHFHFTDKDYYLFFGSVGFKDELKFSFQFNKGNELTELLINNQGQYHRFDVAEVLESGFYTKFRLNDDQIIQLETYANGKTKGLMISDITNSNEESKFLLDLPIARLKLDSTDVEVILKSEESSTSNELPEAFKKYTLEQEQLDKRTPYYLIGIIIVIALILYYFLF